MLITTTPGIEGRPVTEYLGIVTAQGVLGVNAFKDVSAGVRNVFGGRARSYENELASGGQRCAGRDGEAGGPAGRRRGGRG